MPLSDPIDLEGDEARRFMNDLEHPKHSEKRARMLKLAAQIGPLLSERTYPSGLALPLRHWPRVLLSPRKLWGMIQVWKMGRRLKAEMPDLNKLLEGMYLGAPEEEE